LQAISPTDRAAIEKEVGGRYLEPSAGTGNIALAIKNAGGIPYCIEYSWQCAEFLERTRKIENVEQKDFLEVQPPADLYDGCIMNPPFWNRADIRHVRHAYGFIRPGTLLVAVMSAGTLYRSDRETTEFRSWIEERMVNCENLEAGTFKASGTMVSTILLTLEKQK